MNIKAQNKLHDMDDCKENIYEEYTNNNKISIEEKFQRERYYVNSLYDHEKETDALFAEIENRSGGTLNSKKTSMIEFVSRLIQQIRKFCCCIQTK